MQQRGSVAFDVDEDGFKSWYETATDQLAPDQRVWEDTTVEWRSQHHLKVARAKVEQLLDIDAPVVFLCGSSPNDADFVDLCDRVIHLAVFDDTLRHRLATRTNNDYGNIHKNSRTSSAGTMVLMRIAPSAAR